MAQLANKEIMKETVNNQIILSGSHNKEYYNMKEQQANYIWN